MLKDCKLRRQALKEAFEDITPILEQSYPSPHGFESITEALLSQPEPHQPPLSLLHRSLSQDLPVIMGSREKNRSTEGPEIQVKERWGPGTPAVPEGAANAV